MKQREGIGMDNDIVTLAPLQMWKYLLCTSGVSSSWKLSSTASLSSLRSECCSIKGDPSESLDSVCRLLPPPWGVDGVLLDFTTLDWSLAFELLSLFWWENVSLDQEKGQERHQRINQETASKRIQGRWEFPIVLLGAVLKRTRNFNRSYTLGFNQFNSPCFRVFFSSLYAISLISWFSSTETYRSRCSSSIKSRLLYGR